MAFDLGFDALADPVRREILGLLADRGESSVGEIAESVPHVGRTTVSSHLSVLRKAALIIERRDGRFRYYSIALDGPAQQILTFLATLFGSVADPVADAVADAVAEEDRSGLAEPGGGHPGRREAI